MARFETGDLALDKNELKDNLKSLDSWTEFQDWKEIREGSIKMIEGYEEQVDHFIDRSDLGVSIEGNEYLESFDGENELNKSISEAHNQYESVVQQIKQELDDTSLITDWSDTQTVNLLAERIMSANNSIVQQVSEEMTDLINSRSHLEEIACNENADTCRIKKIDDSTFEFTALANKYKIHEILPPSNVHENSFFTVDYSHSKYASKYEDGKVNATVGTDKNGERTLVIVDKEGNSTKNRVIVSEGVQLIIKDNVTQYEKNKNEMKKEALDGCNLDLDKYKSSVTEFMQEYLKVVQNWEGAYDGRLEEITFGDDYEKLLQHIRTVETKLGEISSIGSNGDIDQWKTEFNTILSVIQSSDELGLNSLDQKLLSGEQNNNFSKIREILSIDGVLQNEASNIQTGTSSNQYKKGFVDAFNILKSVDDQRSGITPAHHDIIDSPDLIQFDEQATYLEDTHHAEITKENYEGFKNSIRCYEEISNNFFAIESGYNSKTVDKMGSAISNGTLYESQKSFSFNKYRKKLPKLEDNGFYEITHKYEKKTVGTEKKKVYVESIATPVYINEEVFDSLTGMLSKHFTDNGESLLDPISIVHSLFKVKEFRDFYDQKDNIIAQEKSNLQKQAYNQYVSDFKEKRIKKQTANQDGNDNPYNRSYSTQIDTSRPILLLPDEEYKMSYEDFITSKSEDKERQDTIQHSVHQKYITTYYLHFFENLKNGTKLEIKDKYESTIISMANESKNATTNQKLATQIKDIDGMGEFALSNATKNLLTDASITVLQELSILVAGMGVTSLMSAAVKNMQFARLVVKVKNAAGVLPKSMLTNIGKIPGYSQLVSLFGKKKVNGMILKQTFGRLQDTTTGLVTSKFMSTFGVDESIYKKNDSGDGTDMFETFLQQGNMENATLHSMIDHASNYAIGKVIEKSVSLGENIITMPSPMLATKNSAQQGNKKTPLLHEAYSKMLEIGNDDSIQFTEAFIKDMGVIDPKYQEGLKNAQIDAGSLTNVEALFQTIKASI